MKDQRITSFISLLAAAGGLSACAFQGGGGTPGDDVTPPPPPEARPFPARCADVLAEDAHAPDGNYTLYADGDGSQPWIAYCDGMRSGEPAEYLPLPRHGGSYNFSELVVENGDVDDSVRTNFDRVRIDPDTLMIDIGDQHFSVSNGVTTLIGPLANAVSVSSMPFGVAASCSEVDVVPATGRANIDLSGTPFDISADAWCNGGSAAFSGTPRVSSDGKAVDIAGGTSSGVTGDCAWTAPSPPCPDHPFNDQGGAILELAYHRPQ